MKFFHISVGLRHPVVFQNLWEPSVNRKGLRALTLVGPTWNNPNQDPRAAPHLINQLFVNGP